MKLLVAVAFIFYSTVSFWQTPTKSGIDKDIMLSSKLWSEGNLVQSNKISERILKDSKEISYSFGIIEASLNIANDLINSQEFKKANFYIEIAEKENIIFKSRDYSGMINSLKGDRFSGVGLEAEAIHAYKMNLNSVAELAGAASSNIAVAFRNLKIPDSALFYDKKAYQILIKDNRKETWRIFANVCVNVSIDYLLSKSNLDSSRFYLNKGMFIAKKINQPDAFQAVYKGLGMLAIKTNKVDSAIFYFQKSLAIAKHLGNQNKIRELYLKLGSAYELKKYRGKQVEYIMLYQRISDSLSSFNNLPFVVQSMVNENKTLLNREKKNYTIIGIVVIFSGLIIIAFGYLRFRNYKRRQIFLIEEKDNLLDSTTKFKTQYEIDNLGLLLELAKAKDPAFFLKFNEFNPEFKDKLLEKYDSLNLNDVEFCSYLRMNFDTKEIAIYANMTVRAVEAKKYRIRKKMGIFSTDNINLQVLDI